MLLQQCQERQQAGRSCLQLCSQQLLSDDRKRGGGQRRVMHTSVHEGARWVWGEDRESQRPKPQSVKPTAQTPKRNATRGTARTRTSDLHAKRHPGAGKDTEFGVIIICYRAGEESRGRHGRHAGHRSCNNLCKSASSMKAQAPVTGWLISQPGIYLLLRHAPKLLQPFPAWCRKWERIPCSQAEILLYACSRVSGAQISGV